MVQRESLYTKTVDNGDGTKTLEVYGEPVRYEAKDGSVKDISLVPVTKGNGFTTGDHRLSISFPEKAEAGISLNTGKHVITATPVAENGTAVKTSSAYLSDADAVVYRTDPKTSYEYNITYSGYKENIVVSEYTGQTDYYFRIETDGLLLVASEGDPARGAGLELKDTEGRTAARIGNIIVFSSDNRNNTFGSVGFETVTERDEYIIRISVPEAYLSDPATHYPIYIDPTITVAYNANNSSTWDDIEDITVNQNQAADPPNYGTLYVGKAGPDYGAMRSVMRFPELELYGIIPGNITSATVNVRDLMCYGFTLQVDCYGYGGALPTGAFTTSNMTWSAVYNTMQYYESLGVFRSSHSVSYNAGEPSGFWYGFNILPVVQSWAQGRNAGTLAQTDQAIVFKATDTYEQSTSEQYVCFGSYDVVGAYEPSLVITYNAFISISESCIDVDEGGSVFLSAETYPTGATVSWSSSNANIAAVGANGMVTGIAAKSSPVTITASITIDGTDYYDACYVYVTIADGIYYLKNQNSDYYLSVCEGSVANGTDVIQEPRSNTDVPVEERIRQMWRVRYLGGGRYSLRPMHKLNMGLDAGNFGNVEIYGIGLTDSLGILLTSQWTIGRLTSSSSGCVVKCHGASMLAMHVNDSSTVSGESVVVGNYLANADYRWTFERIANPPSGVLLYDTSTYSLANNVTRTVDPGESKTKSQLDIAAAVYSDITSDQNVVWYSGDTSTVTVDSVTGTITGVRTGTATITAQKTIGNNTYSASYTVKVNKNAIIIIPGLFGSELIAGNNNTFFFARDFFVVF